MTELNIGALTGSKSYIGSVGTTNIDNLYKFTINSAGSFKFAIDDLSGNADIFLLNQAGAIIKSSSNGDKTAETINAEGLSAGEYTIRVLQISGDINYTLNLAQVNSPQKADADTLTGTKLETASPSTAAILPVGSTSEKPAVSRDAVTGTLVVENAVVVDKVASTDKSVTTVPATASETEKPVITTSTTTEKPATIPATTTSTTTEKSVTTTSTTSAVSATTEKPVTTTSTTTEKPVTTTSTTSAVSTTTEKPVTTISTTTEKPVTTTSTTTAVSTTTVKPVTTTSTTTEKPVTTTSTTSAVSATTVKPEATTSTTSAVSATTEKPVTTTSTTTAVSTTTVKPEATTSTTSAVSTTTDKPATATSTTVKPETTTSTTSAVSTTTEKPEATTSTTSAVSTTTEKPEATTSTTSAVSTTTEKPVTTASTTTDKPVTTTSTTTEKLETTTSTTSAVSTTTEKPATTLPATASTTTEKPVAITSTTTDKPATTLPATTAAATTAVTKDPLTGEILATQETKTGTPLTAEKPVTASLDASKPADKPNTATSNAAEETKKETTTTAIPATDTKKEPEPTTDKKLTSPFTSGIFTTDQTGRISIDYTFDGGFFQGELAVFSLEGLEKFEAGSEAFIKEVTSRSLSNSVKGHVVINDATEGARFSGFLGESNVNEGAYLGVKSFAVTAGGKYGVMLVPNGSVKSVFDNPTVGGAGRPLFSMAMANPVQGFNFGQIADVTGEGNTFVMEDMRLDAGSDKDYNDIIFQVRGATAKAALLDTVINPDKDWRKTDLGKAVRERVTFAMSKNT